ncbi:MAG: hypothetical protein SOI26_05570 [Coriobacteriales bacterium]|jgi:hypothetical protein
MMVYLELVGDDGETVTYDYMPEREDAVRGTITVSRSGEYGIPMLASGDDFGWYAGHALRRVREMLSSGNLKERAVVAWY